jgi:hypothetical protein
VFHEKGSARQSTPKLVHFPAKKVKPRPKVGAMATRDSLGLVLTVPVPGPSGESLRAEQSMLVPLPQGARSVRPTKAGPTKKWKSVSTKSFSKMASLPRKGTRVSWGAKTQLMVPSWALKSWPTLRAVRRRPASSLPLP